MNDEIKTEDVITSLRFCASRLTPCTDECPVYTPGSSAASCCAMYAAAADRLERLTKRLNDMSTENELLRGALRSAGHMEGTMSKLTININQLLKIADAIPLAEYNGRKLYVGIWHHFKGKDYFVIGIAVHTETDETLVLYKDSLFSSKQYARPLEMFMSEVDREKYPNCRQKYRFERKDSRNE